MQLPQGDRRPAEHKAHVVTPGMEAAGCSQQNLWPTCNRGTRRTKALSTRPMLSQGVEAGA
eukprot:1161361-Pelagomonas_calceolata.AAC.2